MALPNDSDPILVINETTAVVERYDGDRDGWLKVSARGACAG